jgi:thiol-disulfide isomerase/thioredoxin
MPPRGMWAQLAAIALALTACHRGAKVPEGDVAAEIAAAKPVGPKALDPAALHGKPALVLFVSPTCKYCLATLPRAAASASAHGAGLVAVFTAGGTDSARGVVDYIHFPGKTLVDDGTLVHRYHIDHVPYTLVLDRDGHARDAYEGEQDQSTFDDALAEL